MKTVKDLLPIYRERLEASHKSLLLSEEDLKARLLRLAGRNCFFLYKDRGEERLYRQLIQSDAEETLTVFRQSRNRLFANQVDHSVAWSVLFWAVRLFTWAAERNDWKPVRDHAVTLESIFCFFQEADYAWIRSGQAGLLEVRFKKEYPFVSSGEVWYSSVFNALWASFVCLFSVFCNRTGNLRFASRSQDLLDSLMEVFHSFFWDKKRSELAHLVHPERERKIFTGWTAYAAAYDPAGLLFKNRKKRMLEVLERQYYTEKGLRYDGEKVEASLLPVYWDGLLAFYGSSGRTLGRVEKLVREHATFIDPVSFAKGDVEYERGMTAILRILAPGF